MKLFFNFFPEVADPDAEEGEIFDEEDKVRYDLSKLIEFPGFNAPMPDDVLDVRKITYLIIDTNFNSFVILKTMTDHENIWLIKNPS